MMREVRVLQRYTRAARYNPGTALVTINGDLLSDRLSRTWDPSDLTVRVRIRREVLSAYAHVGLSGSGALEYRPLGVHSVVMTKVTTNALSEWWRSERIPLYCPPFDLILPTMLKIKREKAFGVL
jgi:hypothetical protein